MKLSIPTREAWTPGSPEEQTLVLKALGEILESVHFRGSRRYPAMLEYIVKKTLEGERDSIKERTIGVEVFGRDLGYDTNADPVVRFSAGEVRKRLAQFYMDNPAGDRVELELPLGTYIPKLYRRIPVETPPQTDSPAETPVEPNAFLAQPEPEVRPSFVRHRWSVYGTALFLIVSAAILWGAFYRPAKPLEPLMAVWSPLLTNPNSILISIGRPRPLVEVPAAAPDISIGDHILRPEFRISITSVDAAANIAGFLQTRKKPFRIHEASTNTLEDLHGRPVVLVNGNNNKWTHLLLAPLRFHFVDGDFSYIQDTQNPNNREWNVDFSKPYLSQTVDYAIIARFRNATTGGPVLVVAGISSNGTEAAGEFIVSPESLSELLSKSPATWSNFEAVLKIEVVGGQTGAATIIASQFW